MYVAGSKMRCYVLPLLIPLCVESFSAAPLRRNTASSIGLASSESEDFQTPADRRNFLTTTVASSVICLSSLVARSPNANAIGPVKLDLKPTSYFAQGCPPSKPMPGQKAMFGMKGLCVTVEATLPQAAPKELEKVGVYGFVTDGISGDSVLANNPDLSTDAGQFAMIETVTPSDKKVTFEFVAAIPKDSDLSAYPEGIGPLKFDSLRLISFPGGQQYGAINPCEMNEFSDECEAWEAENGAYEKGDFMVRSNPRTKGR